MPTLTKYDFEDSVGCWITSTSHAFRRALEVELAKESITFRQWEVLAWISICGDLTQADLTERIGIEAPTLAGVLARMERDGWLTRYACPNDARKKCISVTEKAAELWDRMVSYCHHVRSEATKGIPPEHLAILKETCEKIRRNLGWPLELFVNPQESDLQTAGRDT